MRQGRSSPSSHPSASPPALVPSLPCTTAPPASTIPYNPLSVFPRPCIPLPSPAPAPSSPQGGCPAWCQAGGTLGTWLTTLAAQPAPGAARGSLLGPNLRRAARGRCRFPLLPRDEERGSRGLSGVWRREGDREEGGRWRSLFNSWRQAMQLCRSDGPCSPRPRHPLPGRARTGRQRQEGKAGSRAGRLARGWQLGSLSRVIKSRNASPRAAQGRRCLPARQGMAAPPGRGHPRAAGGHSGTGARHKGLSRSLQAPWGGWQWVGPQAGSEGPPNLLQASLHCSASSVAQLPPGTVALPGDSHPGARWHPRAGAAQTGTPGPEEEA